LDVQARAQTTGRTGALGGSLRGAQQVIAPLLWALASWLTSAWCAVTRPSSLTCPEGTRPRGVRPSGHTTCDELPPPPVPGECRGGPCDFSDVPERGQLSVRIWCAPGEQAVITGERSVGCQAVRET
jgi:hypothetical protein